MDRLVALILRQPHLTISHTHRWRQDRQVLDGKELPNKANLFDYDTSQVRSQVK